MIKILKQCFLMKFIPLFLKKEKIVQAYKQSVLQLMSVLSRNEDKDIINNFKCNAKTHSTMDEKKFIPLYAEDKGRLTTYKYLSTFYI